MNDASIQGFYVRFHMAVYIDVYQQHATLLLRHKRWLNLLLNRNKETT